ncbi:unnamed protein product, partial [Allacma fusca]
CAECGWEKLKKYYPSSDGEAYIISTILDPRCKLEFFKNSNWRKEWIDNCKKTINEVWKKNYIGNESALPVVTTNYVVQSESHSIFENMF